MLQVAEKELARLRKEIPPRVEVVLARHRDWT